ncbi:hypothetical protein [Hymenobacter persicinus]|uniref:Uncharacterized protein n=1 Tax=Hymenobacter persicinus TaxID=2025506 RepID=A0A4Q5LF44_9BACT|nr:hypothetical protein [Hymenobacter persicinus]RYU83254.1 hypothetical protein EWM57_02915 [Hymenobacter persicinus]
MDSFPFEVRFINGAQHGSPEQMYQVFADFSPPELATYKALFQKYSSAGDDFSLVEVTFLLIDFNTDDLVDHMDFDEEGFLLDMHLDSESALQEFIDVACPIFRDMAELESYLSRSTGMNRL